MNKGKTWISFAQLIWPYKLIVWAQAFCILFLLFHIFYNYRWGFQEWFSALACCAYLDMLIHKTFKIIAFYMNRKALRLMNASKARNGK